MTANLRSHLDRLDTALAGDNSLPWLVAVREDEAIVLDSRLAEVVEVGPADAALIVAAVNALPGLLAGVRAADEALRLIAGDRCETFTRGRCSDPLSGRTRGAQYGAYRWCDACVAADALAALACALPDDTERTDS